MTKFHAIIKTPNIRLEIYPFVIAAELYWIEEPVELSWHGNPTQWINRPREQRDVDARSRWFKMIEEKVRVHNAAIGASEPEPPTGLWQTKQSVEKQLENAEPPICLPTGQRSDQINNEQHSELPKSQTDI